MSPKKSDAPASPPARTQEFTPAPTRGGQIAEDGTHTTPLPEPDWHRAGRDAPKE